MSTPAITLTQWGEPGMPLLVLGPSLGTSAETLWGIAARDLGRHFHVLAWDLPGHGHSAAPREPFTMAELAAGVVAAVDRAVATTDRASFAYAGDSVGGCIGQQLLLDVPERVTAAVLIATGAKIGESDAWLRRAEQVRASGTPSMVGHSAKVWFAPGFLDREPERGAALLHALQGTNADGYAAVCEALAGFDVRDQLARITAPVLTLAGEHDRVTPPASLAVIADAVVNGRSEVLKDVAHLAPIETPEKVADQISRHIWGARRRQQDFDDGMRVRRAVLGDDHVDRATAGVTSLTADFQDLITRYAWGTIWARPGLDHRTRSLITITALVARGHHDELAMHLRAALRNGVTIPEIRETLLQSAIYCGVPDANAAFRIASDVLGTVPDGLRP